MDSFVLNSEALALNLNDESDFSPELNSDKHFFEQGNETPGFHKVTTLPLESKVTEERQPETLLATPRSLRVIEKPN